MYAYTLMSTYICMYTQTHTSVYVHTHTHTHVESMPDAGSFSVTFLTTVYEEEDTWHMRTQEAFCHLFDYRVLIVRLAVRWCYESERESARERERERERD